MSFLGHDSWKCGVYLGFMMIIKSFPSAHSIVIWDNEIRVGAGFDLFTNCLSCCTGSDFLGCNSIYVQPASLLYRWSPLYLSNVFLIMVFIVGWFSSKQGFNLDGSILMDFQDIFGFCGCNLNPCTFIGTLLLNFKTLKYVASGCRYAGHSQSFLPQTNCRPVRPKRSASF